MVEWWNGEVMAVLLVEWWWPWCENAAHLKAFGAELPEFDLGRGGVR